MTYCYTKSDMREKEREVRALKDRVATLERQRDTLTRTLRDVQANLGQRIHTAFRNIADYPNSFLIWSWIGDIPDDVWKKIVTNTLDSLGVTQALEQMKKTTEKESSLTGTEVP